MRRDQRFAAASSATYALLRVVAGLLFAQFGGRIVLGWFQAASEPKTPLGSQIGIGGVLELVGGVLILLGLCTRPVALLLSGEMAVAYWQFHAPHGGWPIQNHGELAVLFCFVFLFMAAAGGGDWSLDAWLRRKKNGSRGE